MHSAEVTWIHLQEVAKQAKRLKDTLVYSAELADEYGDIWELHKNNTESIAKQLFSTDAPTEVQIRMVEDMKAVLDEFRKAPSLANVGVLRRLS